MTTNTSLRRMSPLPRVKLRVSRRNGMGGNPKNRVKRSHRIEPAIEPEHVFVEVRLQMLWLDTAMMSTLKPGLQVAKNKMDHGQMSLSFVRITTKRQHVMTVSCLRKLRVTGPSIGAHDSTVDNVLFDKSGERFGAPIWNDAKPQPSRIDSALVLLAVISARPNFNRSDDKSLVVDAASLAARLAADKTLIDLDGRLAAYCVSFWADHASAQLVKNLKRRFITTKGKLALELDGRLSRDLRSHQVRAPKPRRKGRVARLHDRSGRQRSVGLAAPATKHDRGARCEAIRLPRTPALWARKPIRPTHRFKIACACCVVGEYPLKLRERSGGSHECPWSKH